jgi:hypothetical protein
VGFNHIYPSSTLQPKQPIQPKQLSFSAVTPPPPSTNHHKRQREELNIATQSKRAKVQPTSYKNPLAEKQKPRFETPQELFVLLCGKTPDSDQQLKKDNLKRCLQVVLEMLSTQSRVLENVADSATLPSFDAALPINWDRETASALILKLIIARFWNLRGWLKQDF